MQEASRSEAEFKPFNTPYSKSMLTLALQLILLHALNKNQHSSLKQIALALTYPAHLLFNSFYFQPNNILHLICPINIFSVTALEFQFHPEKIQFKNRHVCLIEPDNINSRITFFFCILFQVFIQNGISLSCRHSVLNAAGQLEVTLPYSTVSSW